MSSLKNLSASIRKFHRDEDGMEVLQSILLLAVAAIIAALVKTLGTSANGTASGLVNGVMKTGN